MISLLYIKFILKDASEISEKVLEKEDHRTANSFETEAITFPNIFSSVKLFLVLIFYFTKD